MALRKTATGLLVTGLLVAGSFSALAHMGATGIVKERMEAMSAMKDAMAVIGNMLAGKTDYDQTIALNATSQLLRHGMRIPDQFPDTSESRQKASEATDMVWTDKAMFDSNARDFNDAAQALQVAISVGEMETIKSRFGETGKTCSACHENFRQKNH